MADMKTLDAFMRSRAITKETTVYIGGKEAFVWIGNREQYKDEIDALSEGMVQILRERLEKKENALAHYKRMVELTTTQISRLNARIDNFVPLRSRTVKEYYPKTVPGEEGLAVLIDGPTCGRTYWMKEEYEREETP